jgi:putative copper resistance protein D
MPEGLLNYLLYSDTVALNLALALVLGGLASDIWLSPNVSAWGQNMALKASGIRRVGLYLGLVALLSMGWLQAVSMSDGVDVALGSAAWTLLKDTHLGHAWVVGLVGWTFAGAAVWNADSIGTKLRHWLLAAAGLSLFVWSRSIVSHASSQGDWSRYIAVDWVHLVLVSLWVGIVLVAATIKLPAQSAPRADGLAAVRWVDRLSTTATVALVVIVLTGAYKIWTNIPSIGVLWPSDYGLLLAIKVGLVSVAVALGGYNRFRVLPPLMLCLKTPGIPTGGHWRVHLVRALRLETVVLILVLIAAAVLSSMEPPGAG